MESLSFSLLLKLKWVGCCVANAKINDWGGILLFRHGFVFINERVPVNPRCLIATPCAGLLIATSSFSRDCAADF